MSREFQCKTGECVECCIHKGILIPVTLGDLWRAWVYESETSGSERSFYRVYDERCNGFTFLPIANKPGKYSLVIRSKVPCYNVNLDENGCQVYGKVQYVGCGLFPEDRLLPEDEDSSSLDNPATIDFCENLDCLQDVELAPGRTDIIKARQSLTSSEILMGSDLLLFGMSKRDVKNQKRFKRELRDRLQYISRSAMHDLWKNVRQTTPKYIDLYVTDEEVAEILRKRVK